MKKVILLAAVLAIGVGGAMAASTQQNRDDSLILVGIAPIGIHIPTFLTRPVTVGVYLGESLLLGVEAGSFDFSSDDFDPDSGEQFDGEFTNIGAYARWFPGSNSFNLLFAVHQRDLSFRYQDIFGLDSGATATLIAQLDTSATVATVGFGNQWMMDFGLVLAMDWVLLSGNISESHTFQASAGNIGLNASEQARYDAEIQDAADTVNKVVGFPGIFVFSLGWAF